MIVPHPFFPPFTPMRNNNVGKHNIKNNYSVPFQSNDFPNDFYKIKNKQNATFNTKHINNNMNYDIDKKNLKVFDLKNNNDNINENEPIFEIFGIKFFFDDLLIIALLLFLYNEDCTDDYLFIVLFLLLLS